MDLIVTDLKMPVMNGYELVEYVNRNFPHLPVYVMTGDYLPDVKPRLQRRLSLSVRIQALQLQTTGLRHRSRDRADEPDGAGRFVEPAFRKQ